jgi:CRISPR-associated protein Cmr4
MFEAKQLIFYYAVSPVHMGAGSAIGAIDSPIQREVHTQHPMFAGSGIKGALRHHFNQTWLREQNKPNSLINRIFGPDTASADFAGALSFSDAQLVALPVRSLKQGYAYVTSPLALARLLRLAQVAGVFPGWTVPAVPEAQALVAGDDLLADDKLVLEAFAFSAQKNDEIEKIAKWLAEHVFAGDGFFSDKLKTDLVLLSDTHFAHFARHAMVVEPHVRINDDSGTADDGGLFYVENLPPESILVGMAQASVERYKKGDSGSGRLQAEEVLAAVLKGRESLAGIAGKALQIGGDASTGRGLVLVQPVTV